MWISFSLARAFVNHSLFEEESKTSFVRKGLNFKQLTPGRPPSHQAVTSPKKWRNGFQIWTGFYVFGIAMISIFEIWLVLAALIISAPLFLKWPAKSHLTNLDSLVRKRLAENRMTSPALPFFAPLVSRVWLVISGKSKIKSPFRVQLELGEEVTFFATLCPKWSSLLNHNKSALSLFLARRLFLNFL